MKLFATVLATLAVNTVSFSYNLLIWAKPQKARRCNLSRWHLPSRVPVRQVLHVCTWQPHSGAELRTRNSVQSRHWCLWLATKCRLLAMHRVSHRCTNWCPHRGWDRGPGWTHQSANTRGGPLLLAVSRRLCRWVAAAATLEMPQKMLERIIVLAMHAWVQGRAANVAALQMSQTVQELSHRLTIKFKSHTRNRCYEQLSLLSCHFFHMYAYTLRGIITWVAVI